MAKTSQRLVGPTVLTASWGIILTPPIRTQITHIHIVNADTVVRRFSMGALAVLSNANYFKDTPVPPSGYDASMPNYIDAYWTDWVMEPGDLLYGMADVVDVIQYTIFGRVGL